MPDTGAPWNIPYVAGTDLVRDWPTDSQTLAEAIADALDDASTIVGISTATTNSAFSTSASGVPSTITNGVEILSLSYTPASATNKLIVATNTVSMYETSNVGERFWLALWDGSTFVAASSGTAPGTSFASGLNAAYTSINYEYTAGSTSTRTISVRAGGDTTAVINTNAYTGTGERLLSMTVIEVVA